MKVFFSGRSAEVAVIVMFVTLALLSYCVPALLPHFCFEPSRVICPSDIDIAIAH
jgi:hypothetical protein